MKKRLLAVILSLCVLFAMSTVVSAAGNVNVDSEIITTKRFCPGAYITEETMVAPEYSGPVFVSGWEIQMPGSTNWIPYQGEALTEEYDGALLHYYVRSYKNESAYSNECTLIVKHNPIGDYYYSGTEHWRACADCNGKADVELHSFHEDGVDFGNIDGTMNNTICKTCGAHKTTQWSGIAVFFKWILAILAALGLG